MAFLGETSRFSPNLLNLLPTVLVRPQLEYCSTVWCPFTDSNISKLEAVQRRTARWVKHDYGQTSSVTEMMQSLHWHRLDQRRIDNKLSLMYKITNNLIAIPISDFLIPLVRPSRHYHPLSYRLITATTDYYNFSFFPRAVLELWNNLPLETMACSTMQSARMTTSHHRKLLLNLTCILTYFIFSRCILVTPPSLF